MLILLGKGVSVELSLFWPYITTAEGAATSQGLGLQKCGKFVLFLFAPDLPKIWDILLPPAIPQKGRLGGGETTNSYSALKTDTVVGRNSSKYMEYNIWRNKMLEAQLLLSEPSRKSMICDTKNVGPRKFVTNLHLLQNLTRADRWATFIPNSTRTSTSSLGLACLKEQKKAPATSIACTIENRATHPTPFVYGTGVIRWSCLSGFSGCGWDSFDRVQHQLAAHAERRGVARR